ncbi:MAG: hypothetical protein CL908_18045 [Deltaproteobacteria bacterium]|jgi:hypothetical protein|nr:hypothetical protein [Deltaproteobacteria bacterium]
MLNGVLLLAAVAAICAGVGVWLWRQSESRAAGLAAANRTLEGERDRLAADLSKETKARRRQAEQLAGHRKKADKAKKRQARPAAQPLGTASRIRDLEDRLEQGDAAQRRVEAERDLLVARVGTLEARLDLSARKLEQASVQVEPETPTALDESSGAAELDRLRTELTVSREQTKKLEAARLEARETEARLRKRAANQEQLYASLRAELEVKKDRLRTQEEQLQRLRALKVAVAASEPASDD